MKRGAAFYPGDRSAGAVLQRRNVEPDILGLAVEHHMLARMHRFLIEKIIDLAAQGFRRAAPIMAHRSHEEFFADGKGRGESVEKGCASGVAAMPPTRRGGLSTEFQVALFDLEIVGGLRRRRHKRSPRINIDINVYK